LETVFDVGLKHSTPTALSAMLSQNTAAVELLLRRYRAARRIDVEKKQESSLFSRGAAIAQRQLDVAHASEDAVRRVRPRLRARHREIADALDSPRLDFAVQDGPPPSSSSRFQVRRAPNAFTAYGGGDDDALFDFSFDTTHHHHQQQQ